jgi:ElaB/YqjD/DUF883 family membrane-anchored ribosome-binding protein
MSITPATSTPSPSTSFANGNASDTASTDAIHRGVDTAGAALHSSIDKVAIPARSAVDRMSTAAHESVDKLASTANSTADRFSTQTRRVTEAPARALESSKTWVQAKPLEAVGIALAFGFIVGRLTSR